MKVLMFGWEFPPFKSGGLGTVCYDLTKGLCRIGVKTDFVMPFVPEGTKADFVKLVSADEFSKNIKVIKFNTLLSPYMTQDSYAHEYSRLNGSNKSESPYSKNLYAEVYRYGVAAGEIAKSSMSEGGFDIIHAHDWMTFQAGINAKKATKRPLVVHIHNTVFDRYAGNKNDYEYAIEKEGFERSDRIIAISNHTKRMVVDKYGIDPGKIDVVHWGIDRDKSIYHNDEPSPFIGKKLIVSVGRLTIQKGLDYLISAAKKVIAHDPTAMFVFVGDGEMKGQLIDQAAGLGIINNMVFAGWLNGDDVHKAFQMADLFVMPSVSEPFGVVALESLKNNTPILISKQSGAAEVVNNALKVDFWDIDEMANKIISVLKYPSLKEDLAENGNREADKFSLEEPARKCVDVYRRVIGR